MKNAQTVCLNVDVCVLYETSKTIINNQIMMLENCMKSMQKRKQYAFRSASEFNSFRVRIMQSCNNRWFQILQKYDETIKLFCELMESIYQCA